MNFVYFAVIIGCVCVGHGEGKTCYEVTCFSKNCTEEAINAGTAATCTMDESYGCEFIKMSTVDTDMEIAKCASSSCTPVHSAPALDSMCCNENNCNTGNITSGPAPASGLCHSFICTNGYDCLKSGIKDGNSRTCPMDPKYGCYALKAATASTGSVLAGCSNSRCMPAKVSYGGDRSESICCSSNLCNDGETNSGGKIRTLHLALMTFIIAGLLIVMDVY